MTRMRVSLYPLAASGKPNVALATEWLHLVQGANRIAGWLQPLDRVMGELIGVANDTDRGLASPIDTRDMETAFEASRRNAGFVQVNAGYTIQPNLSYGGFGQSGLGEEASMVSMLEHFTRKKTIVFAQA